MKNDDFQVHNLRSREAVEKLRMGAERELKITLKSILAKEKLFKGVSVSFKKFWRTPATR